MFKVIFGGLIGAVFFGNVAMAQTCASYPYTFSNGTTADATQVNSDFNTIRDCANNNLAPLDSPSFTGNVGIGTTSPASILQLDTTNFSTTAKHLVISAGTPTAWGSYPGSYTAALQIQSNSNNAVQLVPTTSGQTDLITAGGGFRLYTDATLGSGIGTLALTATAGKIGIGTTTPVALLNPAQDITMAGTTSLLGQVVLSGATDTNKRLVLGVDTTGTPFGFIQSTWPGHNYESLALNPNGGNVGIGTGTTAPAQALEVNGMVKVDTFAAGTSIAVCQNAGVLSTCNSSSIRYKENVKDAQFGLNDILKMRPVTFKWKGRDENDLGFIAEEVAKINPLFVTYKDKDVEGVKYAQLTAVLVSAIKELKGTNDKQATQIALLQNQVSELQRKFGIQAAAHNHLRQRTAYVTGQR